MNPKRLAASATVAVAAMLNSSCISLVFPGIWGTDLEPNNDPTQAVLIGLDNLGQAKLSGAVRNSQDVDVYDLGAVQPGDRITVSVTVPLGGTLDPVVALFDADLNLINYNDDVDYPGGNFNSFIDHVVRHATDHCYIAVTDSGFSPSSGSYSLHVQVTRDGQVPTPVHQTVLLDFDGATVSIPGDRTYVIGAFNAGQVDPRLADREEWVEQGIRDILEDRYAAYDIDFVITGEPNQPSEGTYSSLVFGGRSATMFGISQWVDHYNQDPTDTAIIFTTLWTSPFSFIASLDAILTSLGNVAAHELGHLLGLEHTADTTELMDASGTADTILAPQVFKVAPLYDQVFPFGWQDAPQLLLDALGPNPNAP